MPPKKKDPNAAKNRAAIRIQCVIRKFMARARMRKVSYRTWQRVYDPAFKLYFFYNRVNGKSQWTLPMFMQWFTKEDEVATRTIERVVRSFLGRMKARKVAHDRYVRYFDANVSKFYFTNKVTGLTFWKASRWLTRQAIPMPYEDEMMYNQYLKIQELTKILAQKDNEIKEVRKKRYEELEPEVLADRVKNAKSLVRSKNMDEWSIDELAAWFTELKMDQYVPFIYKNRVDGNLFINLQETDWGDMGIKNNFHIRKLQLILKAFLSRYEKKKNKDPSADDELASEYAPSELSDIIRAENEDDEFDEEFSEDGDGPIIQQEIVKYELTQEQIEQRALDEQNVQIEIVIPGDGINYPVTGDIVRVKFTCYLLPSKKLVTSTKNGYGKPSVEFVLGVDQIVKGFDRALTRMSVGERSRINMTAEYAYGKDGLWPHVPPDSEIGFEATLLGFRPRPLWFKPLLQEPGLSEKPYLPTALNTAKVGGVLIPADDTSVTSSLAKK